MSDYISAELRARIRQQEDNRCGYCLSLQKYVWGTLEIEHIIPKAAGGNSDEENLWMACRPCNSHKADRTSGTDPLKHFIIHVDSNGLSTLSGRTMGLLSLG